MAFGEALAYDSFEAEEQSVPMRPPLYLVYNRDTDEFFELEDIETPEGNEAPDNTIERRSGGQARKKTIHYNSAEHAKILNLAQSGDIEAKAIIIEANQGLITLLANGYSLKRIDFEDLLQAGVLGMYDAIEHFDANRNPNFGAHARYRIKNAMKNGILEAKGLSAREYMIRSLVINVEERLSQELQRTPTIDELHCACVDSGNAGKHVTREAVEIVRYGGRVQTVLNQPIGDYSDEELGDFVLVDENTAEDLALESLQAELRLACVGEAIGQLTDRQKTVTEALFYYDDEPSTYEEIAADLGVDRSRVGQLRIASLKKIKAHIEAAGLEEATL